MKVALVDYIGYSDKNGTPVGHTLKILNEYGKMIEGSFTEAYYAPQKYIDVLNAKEKYKVPFFSDTTRRGKNSLNNIVTMIKSFINISYVLNKSDAEIVWFCNVDQFLYMYLGIFGFHKKKIVITTFTDKYLKEYHNYFLNKVRNKISLFIKTNENSKCKGFFMPDYLYSGDIYLPYKKKQKTNKIVCVGTMSRSKKIKEIVQLCNEKKWNLEIYGFFYDKAYYDEVMSIKQSNIHIENRYLEYGKYLELLGEAKYCFFNYSQEAYKNITSGVILECIFMDCIPIANSLLLSNMKIEGIGFKTFDDIDFGAVNEEAILENNKRIIDERYNMENVKVRLQESFSKL